MKKTKDNESNELEYFEFECIVKTKRKNVDQMSEENNDMYDFSMNSQSLNKNSMLKNEQTINEKERLTSFNLEEED